MFGVILKFIQEILNLFKLFVFVSYFELQLRFSGKDFSNVVAQEDNTEADVEPMTPTNTDGSSPKSFPTICPDVSIYFICFLVNMYLC